ncbi:MAG: UDP-N-acetylglucosamine diphosphorylase [Opitutales bacterium]
MKASDLFTPSPDFIFKADFVADAFPWEWVTSIATALAAFSFPAIAPQLPPGIHCEGPVFLHPSVTLPHTCTIIGPAHIGAGTVIRPGAYIRGQVIAGENCVLGNSCEFKNCLLLDRVQVPHFSYVGDSVLGNGCHLGAGVILSNLRLDQAIITARLPGGPRSTGLRKLGTLAGDGAEVGCNAVLQPGTILGRNSLVMPSLPFGGFLEAGMIAKTRTSIVTIPRRDR